MYHKCHHFLVVAFMVAFPRKTKCAKKAAHKDEFTGYRA